MGAARNGYKSLMQASERSSRTVLNRDRRCGIECAVHHQHRRRRGRPFPPKRVSWHSGPTIVQRTQENPEAVRDVLRSLFLAELSDRRTGLVPKLRQGHVVGQYT